MLIFLSPSSFGQKSIPSKKQYVIVKSTFDFLKQVNRYKANSFTKFLFSKAGYEVYLDNEELPGELYYNKCSALYVDVKDKSNLFATRNYIELADCNGKLMYTSKLGTSKLKDYERSFRQSIRGAFSTIENLNLIYSSFSSLKIESSKTENKTQELNKASEVVKPQKSPLDTSNLISKEKKSSTMSLLRARNIFIYNQQSICLCQGIINYHFYFLRYRLCKTMKILVSLVWGVSKAVGTTMCSIR